MTETSLLIVPARSIISEVGQSEPSHEMLCLFIVIAMAGWLSGLGWCTVSAACKRSLSTINTTAVAMSAARNFWANVCLAH